MAKHFSPNIWIESTIRYGLPLLTFSEPLKWYLEYQKEDTSKVSYLIDEIISGRFESWTEPPTEVANSTFLELGTAVGRVLRPSKEPINVLPLWLECRKADVFFEINKPETTLTRDMHRLYIERIDRKKADDRADRMTEALRAAKVYLDVCFLHPFNDGNGRSARLALDFLLTQSGHCLLAVDPIYIVNHAYVPECLELLTQSLSALIAKCAKENLKI